MTPRLPDELWLHILTFTAPSSAWLSLRHVDQQLQRCVEAFARTTLLPRTTLALTYSLGAGATHRWYEVRATATLAFVRSSIGPRAARFDLVALLPDRTAGRAREKWQRMCADGFAPGLEWRVMWAADGGSRGAAAEGGGAQTWRVRFGIDEPGELGRMVQLRRPVKAEEQNVWVDWREMLDAFFRRGQATVQVGDIWKLQTDA